MMASVRGSFRQNVVPWPGVSENFHRAFQPVQHALHHIQADAASGDFGDLLGGTESRLEDQFQNVAFAEPGRFLRADQFLLDRLGDDAPAVDAAPVVADLYNHLIAVVVGIETDGSAAPACRCARALRRLRCHG